MRGFLQEEPIRCCGTCKWHTKENHPDGEWYCDNRSSTAYEDVTFYDDDCTMWEER